MVAVEDKILLFGGIGISGPLHDTWLLDDTRPECTSFGSGCPGSTGIPQLAPLAGTLPILGTTLRTEATQLQPLALSVVHVGFSESQWGSVSLPFDLGPLGSPGCALLVSGDLALPLANLNGRGTASLPIPAIGALSGFRFGQQAVSLETGGPYPKPVVSNGLRCAIGY